MVKLRIDSGFVGIALDLLTNSVMMDYTTRRIGRILLIQPSDVEAAEKILDRKYIPFKIVQ